MGGPAREASPGDLAALAGLAAAAPALAGTTRVVAVDGRSGAGKTALARALARALRGTGAAVRVLHLDDVYPGWDGLRAGVDELCGSVLAPLAQGRPAAYRRWSWVRSRYAGTAEVAPAPLLLVEGVGAAARCARPYLGLGVWLEAPAAVRRARALARDGAAYAPHWERWAAQEEDLLASEGARAAADVVLDATAPLPRHPHDALAVLPR